MDKTLFIGVEDLDRQHSRIFDFMEKVVNVKEDRVKFKVFFLEERISVLLY